VDAKAFTTVWTGGEMDEATALSLSAVGQGDGESQRDGRVYWIHSVFLRGTVSQPAVESQTTPAGDIIARLALVWDKQTNLAQMAAEQVFNTIAAGDDIDSFRNLQFTKRYQVLGDRKMRLTVANGGMNEGAINLFAAGQQVINFKFQHVFKKPIRVTTSTTAATVAATVDNSLHLIGTSTSAATVLNYSSRVRFHG